nr:NAD(P)-dependent oxidoreductase [Alphaproteobacteria bacterium]
MNRVLVTGASGLIGRQVVRQLSAGNHTVFALSGAGNPPDDAHSPGVKWLQADILDRPAMTRIMKDTKAQGLIHLAWTTGAEFRDSFVDHLNCADASISLINAFAQKAGERLVFAGFFAEYDGHDRYACSSDLTLPDAPLSPRSVL